MDESEIRLVVMKKGSKGILENIAQSEVYPIYLLTKEQITYIAIEECFKELYCCVCHENVSVVSLSQSEIGNVCYYCWKQMLPPIEWKQLDNLEQYVLERK